MTRRRMTKSVLPIIILLVVVVWLFFDHRAGAPGANNSSTTKPKAKPAATQPAKQINQQQYSINQASSLWVVVNKGRVLPASYVPASFGPQGIRSDADAALIKLLAAASKAGVGMKVASGYRSYSYQVSTYNGYVSRDGQAKADTYSARPGHSEHQTGLAADLAPIDNRCTLDQCFGQTAEGKWLATNAHNYGFIIRYQKNTQNLTGYEYEPWHVRYVGTALAAQLYKSGQTLEQYFHLPIYTSYPKNSYQLK